MWTCPHKHKAAVLNLVLLVNIAFCDNAFASAPTSKEGTQSPVGQQADAPAYAPAPLELSAAGRILEDLVAQGGSLLMALHPSDSQRMPNPEDVYQVLTSATPAEVAFAVLLEPKIEQTLADVYPKLEEIHGQMDSLRDTSSSSGMSPAVLQLLAQLQSTTLSDEDISQVIADNTGLTTDQAAALVDAVSQMRSGRSVQEQRVENSLGLTVDQLNSLLATSTPSADPSVVPSPVEPVPSPAEPVPEPPSPSQPLPPPETVSPSPTPPSPTTPIPSPDPPPASPSIVTNTSSGVWNVSTSIGNITIVTQNATNTVAIINIYTTIGSEQPNGTTTINQTDTRGGSGGVAQRNPSGAGSTATQGSNGTAGNGGLQNVRSIVATLNPQSTLNGTELAATLQNAINGGAPPGSQGLGAGVTAGNSTPSGIANAVAQALNVDANDIVMAEQVVIPHEGIQASAAAGATVQTYNTRVAFNFSYSTVQRDFHTPLVVIMADIGAGGMWYSELARSLAQMGYVVAVGVVSKRLPWDVPTSRMQWGVPRESCSKEFIATAPASLLTSLHRFLDANWNTSSLAFLQNTIRDSWVVFGHGVGATNTLNMLNGLCDQPVKVLSGTQQVREASQAALAVLWGCENNVKDNMVVGPYGSVADVIKGVIAFEPHMSWLPSGSFTLPDGVFVMYLDGHFDTAANTTACSSKIRAPDKAGFPITADVQASTISLLASITSSLAKNVLLKDAQAGGLFLQLLDNQANVKETQLQQSCLNIGA